MKDRIGKRTEEDSDDQSYRKVGKVDSRENELYRSIARDQRESYGGISTVGERDSQLTLAESGFECVTEMDAVKLFRKRK